MLADPSERREIDLEQHWDDHQPDQNRDRQIDLGEFNAPDRMKQARKDVSQRDPGDDAEKDPDREIAFED